MNVLYTLHWCNLGVFILWLCQSFMAYEKFFKATQCEFDRTKDKHSQMFTFTFLLLLGIVCILAVLFFSVF